jgi:hypothetical protein
MDSFEKVKLISPKRNRKAPNQRKGTSTVTTKLKKMTYPFI